MASQAALAAVCAELAELKRRLRGLYTQWCVSGPTLEASSALAAMAQEEAGHSRILARLGGTNQATSNLDELLRVDAIGAWPELVGTVGPIEITLAALIREIENTGDDAFARNLTKIAIEERHHAQFFLGWFTELEQNHNAAGELYSTSKQSSEDHIAKWLGGLSDVLADAGVNGIDQLGGDLGPVETNDVPCLHCGSTDVSRTAAFGASLMTSLMRCNACGNQFEAVRWKQSAH